MRFSQAPAGEILAFFAREYEGDIVFSSSMGAEDQVITAMIAGITPAIPVFTLDTGRLFPETYDLIENTNVRYQLKIDILFPEYQQVEKMVKEKGINLFYHSVENRKQCCHIRKMEPLHRALKGVKAWITGIRKEQSVTRTGIQVVEWDEGNGLVKINPLANWTEEEVWNYIHKEKVPYHALHDHGFPSIGCQPCTRAILKGEDVRAGRWWWENPDSRECGLHVKDPG